MKIRGNTITVQQISLKLKGGIMKGTLDMAKNILKGIPTPTEDDHATNKEYVDFHYEKIKGDAKTDTENALKKP
jgi:6,7-dimethyl-8-ribityllumazine synthase